MNCEKCKREYLHAPVGPAVIKLCPLHESAKKMLVALKNLIRSAKTYGTNNMVPAIEEAREAVVDAEK